MITHIEGLLVEKTPTYAVIDCNGVGYVLNISLNTYAKIPDNQKVKLFAHLSIKEDAHTLFGFADNEERTVFKHLISVSGVGAGTARMILSSLTPREVQTAISSGNVALLQKIKGIGLKSAQRLIVDLRDKIAKDQLINDELPSAGSGNRVRNEAIAALVMLGFAKAAAEKAVDKTIKAASSELLVEQLIKEALKSL
jgi:holliday junction DNA helicase RuvA